MAIYGIRWCCAPFIMIPLICWNCTKGAPASPPPIPRGCPLIQVRLFQTKLIMCACVWLNLAISWRSWRNRGTVRAENKRSLQLGENQLSPILKSIIAPEYFFIKNPFDDWGLNVIVNVLVYLQSKCCLTYLKRHNENRNQQIADRHVNN